MHDAMSWVSQLFKQTIVRLAIRFAGDFIPTCSGRRISFSWNPFNRPTPLTNGQNVSLQLGGVRDLAGNVQTRAVNITFVTGTLAPNVSVQTSCCRFACSASRLHPLSCRAIAA